MQKSRAGPKSQGRACSGHGLALGRYGSGGHGIYCIYFLPVSREGVSGFLLIDSNGRRRLTKDPTARQRCLAMRG